MTLINNYEKPKPPKKKKKTLNYHRRPTEIRRRSPMEIHRHRLICILNKAVSEFRCLKFCFMISLYK